MSKQTFTLTVSNEHCFSLSREFVDADISTVRHVLKDYIEKIIKSDSYRNVIRQASISLVFVDGIQPGLEWNVLWTTILDTMEVINPFGIEQKVVMFFRKPIFLINLIEHILNVRAVVSINILLSVPHQ